jgi:hypothetical protein
MKLTTPSIPKQHCTNCHKEMPPQFTKERPFYLRGWLCIQCGIYEKAILRERKFTSAHQKTEDSSQA